MRDMMSLNSGQKLCTRESRLDKFIVVNHEQLSLGHIRKNYMCSVHCIFDTVPEQVALQICKHLNGGSNRHRDGCPSVDHRFSE